MTSITIIRVNSPKGPHYCNPIADAGEVVNVILAIVIGSVSLALLAPEMQGNRAFTPYMFYF
jgi:hypothetical protein